MQEGTMSGSTASTESLEVGKTRWVDNSALPIQMKYLTAITVDNTVFLIGNVAVKGS